MACPILILNYIVLAISLVIPLIAAVKTRTSKAIPLLSWIAVIIFAVASTLLLIKSLAGPVQFYNGLVVHDKFTSFILLGMSLTGALGLVAAGKDPLLWESSPGFYSLLPLALFGAFVISGATDALTVIAAWLLVSVISYVYIALPPDKDSRAAALRYILLGAIATLFLVIWLAANTTVAAIQNLAGLAIAPLTTDKVSGLALAAFIAALGFKTGIAPFQWWVPSVYGRADGRVVSIVAGVLKLAFIALLARVIYLMAGGMLVGSTAGSPFAMPVSGKAIAMVLAVLAVASMTYGNIAALTTDDLRALLAYSAIAQIGYIVAALSALAYFASSNTRLAEYALAAVALQTVAYGLAKAPLFALTSVDRRISTLRGLLGKNRLAGASAGILLFSLLGMPPMLGFWGKIYMFIAVAGFSVVLVVIAFINSAISSAYYVRASRDLLASEGSEVEVPAEIEVSIIAAAALIILFGFIAPIIFSIA